MRVENQVRIYETTFMEQIKVRPPRPTSKDDYWDIFWRCTTCLTRVQRDDNFCRGCGRKFVERES